MNDAGGREAPGGWADRVEIEQLLVRYCHHVDRGPADAIAPLFTEDAVFDVVPPKLTSRAEIDAFYRDRAQRGVTSRHVISNVLVEVDGDRARAISTLRLYRDIGGVEPMLVGDYHDDLVRVDGRWMIAGKRLEIVLRSERLRT